MKKGAFLKVTLLIALMGLLFASSSLAKDKIRIGCAISLSGPYAPGAKVTQIENYELWVEDVNAKGGIYVKELGKRLPVELLMYDDKSDVGTMIRLVEKLILDDKVDLLIGPWGTAMHFAAIPVVNKHKMPFVALSIDSEKLRELIPKYPYAFVILNQPRDKGNDLIELVKEFGIKRVAIIYVADLHGIEMAGYVAPRLGAEGVDVVVHKSYPLEAKDLSPLLKSIKAQDVEALIGFSYPGDTMLITEQAKVLDLNPKLFYLGVGVAHPAYKSKFGNKVVEGVMGHGAWNAKVRIPGVKEYVERYMKKYNHEPDWWGGIFAYSQCMVLQQAIEKAGTLNHERIRETIAKETFPTLLGNVKFVDGFNVEFPGNIGQWQKGVFEVVMPKDKRTAQPLFPKPPWPKD